eukprot:ctg_1726.g530
MDSKLTEGLAGRESGLSMTTAASRRLRSTVTRLPHGESSGFVGRATAAMTGAGEGTAEAECPICLAPLQRSEAGFTCSHCQSRLHWRCCEAWWQREQQQRSVVSSARRPDVCVCPVCAHPERRLPYSTCHCGKSLIARGEHNAPVAASRSCGQVCGGGACGHGGCTRECHSGPCDPCPGTVTVSCVCGRQKTALRCGEYQAGVRSGRAPWLRCRHPCNALLPCGHRCRRVCHARQPLDDENDIAEACLPCEETVTATCVEHGKRWALRCGSIDDPQRFWCGRDLQRRCRCGAALVARHCTDLADSGDQPATAPPPPFCGRICDRRLSCGRHRCVRQCCDDALHACPEVCGKPRRLGTPDACAHVCAVRCHSGAVHRANGNRLSRSPAPAVRPEYRRRFTAARRCRTAQNRALDRAPVRIPVRWGAAIRDRARGARCWWCASASVAMSAAGWLAAPSCLPVIGRAAACSPADAIAAHNLVTRWRAGIAGRRIGEAAADRGEDRQRCGCRWRDNGRRRRVADGALDRRDRVGGGRPRGKVFAVFNEHRGRVPGDVGGGGAALGHRGIGAAPPRLDVHTATVLVPAARGCSRTGRATLPAAFGVGRTRRRPPRHRNPFAATVATAPAAAVGGVGAPARRAATTRSERVPAPIGGERSGRSESRPGRADRGVAGDGPRNESQAPSAVAPGAATARRLL